MTCSFSGDSSIMSCNLLATVVSCLVRYSPIMECNILW